MINTFFMSTYLLTKNTSIELMTRNYCCLGGMVSGLFINTTLYLKNIVMPLVAFFNALFSSLVSLAMFRLKRIPIKTAYINLTI